MTNGDIKNDTTRHLQSPKWTSNICKFLYGVKVAWVGRGYASAVVSFVAGRYGPNVVFCHTRGTQIGIERKCKADMLRTPRPPRAHAYRCAPKTPQTHGVKQRGALQPKTIALCTIAAPIAQPVKDLAVSSARNPTQRKVATNLFDEVEQELLGRPQPHCIFQSDSHALFELVFGVLRGCASRLTGASSRPSLTGR